MVPLNITLVGKQLVEWAPPHSIWIILLPMRRLPLHGYLKPLLPQCIASMGREIDHWKGGRNGTRRGPAFIIFFLGLPDTVQDLPWGRGREARNHGVPLWVLWLSQGNRNMHNCDIGLFLVRQFLAGDYYQWWFDVVQLFVSMHAVCSQGMCAEMVWWEGEHPLWDLPSGWCICILFFNFLVKIFLLCTVDEMPHCTSCGVAKKLSLVGESVS